MRAIRSQAQVFSATMFALSMPLAASLLSLTLIGLQPNTVRAQGVASTPSAVESAIKQAVEVWLKGKYKVDALSLIHISEPTRQDDIA
ncbi:MAG: hypothetical protein RJA72_1567, partial [Pseudomonadota bacterium]